MIRVVLLMVMVVLGVCSTSVNAQNLFVTPKDKNSKDKVETRSDDSRSLPNFVVPRRNKKSSVYVPPKRTKRPSVVYKKETTTLAKEYEIFKQASKIDPDLFLPGARPAQNQEELMMIYTAQNTAQIASALEQRRQMQQALQSRMTSSDADAKTQYLRSVGRKSPKRAVFVPQKTDPDKPKRIFNNFR